MLKRTAFALLVLLLPGDGMAQETSIEDSSESTLVDTTRQPDSCSLEITGGSFLESWDLNKFREQLSGLSAGVLCQFTRRLELGVKTEFLYVRQNPVRDVLLPALFIKTRWSAFRVGKTSVFVEGGGGLSYASNKVPNEGTQFNFATQVGMGVLRPVTQRFSLVGGAHWLHVSNWGLVSPRRNPDIQAIGFDFGFRVNWLHLPRFLNQTD